MPYLNVLAEFREKVRGQARVLKAKDILQECDVLRDEVLPNHGVRLEDDSESNCRIKLVSKEEILREKEMKKQMEANKAAEKEKKSREAAEAAAAKEAQKRIPPLEMFKLESDKYSKFDDKVNS